MSPPFDPTELPVHYQLYLEAIDAIGVHATAFAYDPIPIYLRLAVDYACWLAADQDHACFAIRHLIATYRTATADKLGEGGEG